MNQLVLPLVVLLAACQPTAVSLLDSGADDGLAQLVADQQDQGGTLAELQARMDENEARVASCEQNVALLQASVEAQAGSLAQLQADLDELSDSFETALATMLDVVDASLADLGERIDDLTADVADLAAAVGDLEDAVTDLGGTVAGTPAHAAASSTSASATGGSTSAWASIVTDVTLSVEADDVLVVFCTATDSAAAYAQYRLSVAADDGSWSGTSETIGDTSTSMLAYPGEALTVTGMFTATSTGDVTVACQGRYSSAHDITLMAFTL